MAAQAEGTEMIRRPARAAAGVAVLAIAGVIALIGVGSVQSLGGRIFFGLVVVLDVVLVVRTARSGVLVAPGGLTVRHTLRTRQIRWDEVEYISPPEQDAHRAAGLVTRDGRITCHALGAFRWETAWAPEVRRPYERLSRYFAAVRAEPRSALPEGSA